MDNIILSSQNRTTQSTIRSLTSSGYQLHVVNTPDQLIDRINTVSYDNLLIDLSQIEKLSEHLGFQQNEQKILDELKKPRPTMAIVLIVGDSNIRTALRYVKNGASSYITEPVKVEEVQLVLNEIAKEHLKKSEIAYLREPLWQDESPDIVQTISTSMKKVDHNVISVSPTKTSVLLLGETGTGKSHLARRIHRFSNRKDGPFISVHCGTISESSKTCWSAPAYSKPHRC